jgi:transmembrane 9 superfamily member 2/4
MLQENGKYLLNNHLRFNILFHRDEETDLARIVGFEVVPLLEWKCDHEQPATCRWVQGGWGSTRQVTPARLSHQRASCRGPQVVPFSVQHTYEGAFNEASPELTSCSPGSMKFVTNKEEKQEVAEGKEVVFTYDVLFLVRLLYSRLSAASRGPTVPPVLPGGLRSAPRAASPQTRLCLSVR